MMCTSKRDTSRKITLFNEEQKKEEWSFLEVVFSFFFRSHHISLFVFVLSLAAASFCTFFLSFLSIHSLFKERIIALLFVLSRVYTTHFRLIHTFEHTHNER